MRVWVDVSERFSAKIFYDILFFTGTKIYAQKLIHFFPAVEISESKLVRGKQEFIKIISVNEAIRS